MTSKKDGKCIRVLIADDHPLVLQGIKTVLNQENDIEVVGEMYDGRDIIASVEACRPDIALIDIMMPHVNGLEAVRQLRDKNKQVKVMLLTMHDNPEFLGRSIELEVNGYVLKDSPPDEIVKAVRAVAQGETYYSTRLATALVDRLVKKSGPSMQAVPQVVLTMREKQVLLFLSEGMTSAQIGKQLHLGRRTVETYRQQLMKKLDAHNAVCLLKKALDMGHIK